MAGNGTEPAAKPPALDIISGLLIRQAAASVLGIANMLGSCPLRHSVGEKN
jgi:hypothetical protein